MSATGMPAESYVRRGADLSFRNHCTGSQHRTLQKSRTDDSSVPRLLDTHPVSPLGSSFDWRAPDARRGYDERELSPRRNCGT